MDSKQFDRLATAIAALTSRRSILGGLGAGAGTLLGVFGSGLLGDDTEAKKKKKKKRKRKKKKGQCKNNNGCKQPGNPCQQAVCRGKKCRTENKADGTACGAGQICVGGECLAECGPGSICEGNDTCCAAVCVDTDTSVANCGACGVACPEETSDTCAGGECLCGDAAACAGDLVCEGGECVCPSGQKLCGDECIPEADVCFTLVTPANLDGWLLNGEDDFSNNPALTTIVTGPGTVPAPGDGSVKLDTVAFPPFAENETQPTLRTLQYAGTKVSDIDRLQYSVFVPSTEADPPTMQLAVTGDFNPGGFASLVFIPGQNGNLAPVSDTWVDYTPSDAGFWISTRDILGPSDECLMCRSFGSAHQGDCQTPSVCDSVKTKTWAQIQDLIPDAELNGESEAEGGFSFRIGRGDTGTGNLTNVVFNGDGYFFEQD